MGMAFVFICYVLVMMILYASGALALEGVETGEVHYGFPGDWVKFASVISLIANAFASSQNIPPIVSKLENNSEARFIRVIFAAMAMCLVVYLSAAVSGYLSFGEKTESDVLLRYREGDVPVVIGRVAIGLALLGSMPVQMHPARTS